MSASASERNSQEKSHSMDHRKTDHVSIGTSVVHISFCFCAKRTTDFIFPFSSCMCCPEALTAAADQKVKWILVLHTIFRLFVPINRLNFIEIATHIIIPFDFVLLWPRPGLVWPYSHRIYTNHGWWNTARYPKTIFNTEREREKKTFNFNMAYNWFFGSGWGRHWRVECIPILIFLNLINRNMRNIT